jgi:GNAT superfamily N-acetyltransferase
MDLATLSCALAAWIGCSKYLDLIMHYILRSAIDEDFEFIYTVVKSTMRDYVEAIWGWDERTQRRIHEIRWNPFENMVIVVNGEDAGRLSVDSYDDHVHLNNIQILPEFQGQGLGTQIIQDILNRAGNRPVRLRVLRGNPAKQLYERLGFRVVRESEERFWMEWTSDSPNP